MAQSLKDIDFVIFDVETTGLSAAYGDRIIEVAVVKVRDGKIVDRFESLINPQRDIPYVATMVHGITDHQVANAPYANEVIPKLCNFIGDACLIGHNLRFDLNFLNNECDLIGLDPLEDVFTLDTIRMAKGLYPGMSSYALGSVVLNLGIRQRGAHRAMEDVLMTTDLFLKLCDKAQQRNIRTINHLLMLFSLNKYKKPTNRVKLKLIHEVIDLGGNLLMLYSSKFQGATQRMITPKEIIGKGKAAALSGFCHYHQKEDIISIDKIVQIQTV